MPQYFHDYMHCSQDQCKLKGQCYRYWLGQEIKKTDHLYAIYYHPEKPVTDGCAYFIKTEYFGVRYYDLFVLANTECNMLRTVYSYPVYRKDEDAEIVKYEEIDLNDFENRVL